MFRNQFEMVRMNPNMIMSMIGKDPRWMEVFKVMTGLDLSMLNKA